MKLNEIKENPKARHGKRRVGRGMGSGMGKTAGRGGKGQTARSGVAVRGFEGGQMPIYRRLPKRGFNNIFRMKLTGINLKGLMQAIEKKKLDASKTIDLAAFKAAKLVRATCQGVRILGVGDVKGKLSLDVHGITDKAREKVEKAGGSVNVFTPKEKVRKLPKKEGKTKKDKKEKATKAKKSTKK
ncbi:MAG: 50S ribosomal protein L15 [Alphaproteobacteria bacterium]|nr:50S ribosomal protein L15 [Alphaproteobacteria bacterium]